MFNAIIRWVLLKFLGSAEVRANIFVYFKLKKHNYFKHSSSYSQRKPLLIFILFFQKTLIHIQTDIYVFGCMLWNVYFWASSLPPLITPWRSWHVSSYFVLFNGWIAFHCIVYATTNENLDCFCPTSLL